MLNKISSQKVNIIEILYCCLISIVFISICSTSSPLYPLNMWNDSNCFFTVGKSMFDGVVVYSEIYEQKGILLYFLHGIASIISYDSFLGVWVLEVIFFAVFLNFAAKTILLFIDDNKAVIIVLPILSMILLTDKTFSFGDSAEEFVLPLYMAFIYHSIKYFKGEQERYSFKRAIIDGGLIGCVFWIKFNLIAFFAGYIICILANYLFRKCYKEAIHYLAGISIGAVLATIPWIIYFLVTDSIYDWIYYYFYANTALYTVKTTTIDLLFFIKNIYLYLLETSGQIIVLGVVGIIFVMLSNKKIKNVFGRWGIVVTYFLTVIGVWIGGINHAYYGFALAVFVTFGLIACYNGVKSVNSEFISKKTKKHETVFLVILYLGIAAATYWGANAHNMMWVDKNEIAQYQFAEIINKTEDATLLNYGSLDGGFYTAAGIVPNCKYFCMTNNTELTEMKKVQDEFVKEAKVDYVVTCNDDPIPKFLADNYKLVIEKTETYGTASSIYRLYERIE